MKLNGDTKNKIKKLVQLNKKIYKRYLSLEQNLEKEKNIQVILELIECEQNIIKELNLDKEKLSDIEKYIKSKRRLNLEEDLIKASLKVSAYDYPYLRALARIRYVYSKKTCLMKLIIQPSF